MTNITENWGDGVKMYITNYTINEFNRDYPSDKSFCRTPSYIGVSQFPVVLHEDLVNTVGDKPPGSFCTKVKNTVVLIYNCKSLKSCYL